MFDVHEALVALRGRHQLLSVCIQALERLETEEGQGGPLVVAEALPARRQVAKTTGKRQTVKVTKRLPVKVAPKTEKRRHDNRDRVLAEASQGERTAAEVAEVLGISASLASWHLRALVKAKRLVQTGRGIYAPAPVKAAHPAKSDKPEVVWDGTKGSPSLIGDRRQVAAS